MALLAAPLSLSLSLAAPRPVAPSRGISAQLVASWSFPRGPSASPASHSASLSLPPYLLRYFFTDSSPIRRSLRQAQSLYCVVGLGLKSVEVGLGRPKSGPPFVPVGAWFAPGSIAFCLKAFASRIPLIFSKFSSLIPQLDLRAPLLLW